MKRTILNMAVFVSFLAAPTFLMSQDVAPLSRTGPFSIGLEAGSSCNFTGGAARQGIKDVIAEFEELENGNNDFSGKLRPKVSLFFEAFLDYRIRENLSLRAGLRINRRGYNLRINGEENDPEYQFDHRFEYNEKYRLRTLEFPFSAAYRIKPGLSLNAGFFPGIAPLNSSKMEITITQTTIINGEVSEQLSEGTVKKELNLPDSSNNPFLGVFAGIEYKIYSNLLLSASIQRVENYAKLKHGRLSDTSVSLSVRYLLPIAVISKS